MPLSPSTSTRRRLHTRSIRYEGYACGDGSYEIEARIVDVKDDDYPLASGIRRGGDPVHDMLVRVRINAEFEITDIEAVSDWVPYVGGCDTIGPAYKKLIGLSLLQGFRNGLRDRVGGSGGCTHITELLAGLPTAAIQVRASEIDETEGVDGNRPFQLDRCHALQTDGETVRKYYPKWYRASDHAPADAEAN